MESSPTFKSPLQDDFVTQGFPTDVRNRVRDYAEDIYCLNAIIFSIEGTLGLTHKGIEVEESAGLPFGNCLARGGVK